MVKVLGGILFRIGACYGRAKSIDHHLAQHFDSSLHILDEVPEKPVVLRIISEDFNSHFSDVTNRAFISNDNVPDIRTA